MHGPIAAAMRSRRAPSALHRRDGGLDHAAERALPAGMGRADHAGLAVGEQHRRAIGGEDAEQQAGPVGDQRVGLRARVVGHGSRTVDAVGRMDLVDRRPAARRAAPPRPRGGGSRPPPRGSSPDAEADVEPGDRARSKPRRAGRGSRAGRRRAPRARMTSTGVSQGCLRHLLAGIARQLGRAAIRSSSARISAARPGSIRRQRPSGGTNRAAVCGVERIEREDQVGDQAIALAARRHGTPCGLPANAMYSERTRLGLRQGEVGMLGQRLDVLEHVAGGASPPGARTTCR